MDSMDNLDEYWSSELNRRLKGEILIGDDTPDNIRVLSSMLIDRGHEVRKALNGERTIASALSDPPDIILLDVVMPDMNGYDVCQHLKSQVLTRNIPVLFISASDNVFDKLKGFDAGGVDYITKPFQEIEVMARVNTQLRIRNLQERLIKQNDLLEQSNRELEGFAHTLSHDLQQPLQSIIGFSNLLLNQTATPLDAQVYEYVQRIHGAGNRMQQFIEYLLSSAHFNGINQFCQDVDCNLLINQVRQDLQFDLTKHSPHLDYLPLPTVKGYPIQLTQLFQNLISNALKYKHPERILQLTITATLKTDHYLFTIQDNGIGIKSENLHSIFQLFYLADEVQTISGSGIGLAICKKIVENHQGTIWAESEWGNGTTIFFTLAV